MTTTDLPCEDTYTTAAARLADLQRTISEAARWDDAPAAERAVMTAFRSYRAAAEADSAAYVVWLAPRLH